MLFKNRTAVLLTKHRKEDVIFPVLQETGMILKVETSFEPTLRQKPKSQFSIPLKELCNFDSRKHHIF